MAKKNKRTKHFAVDSGIGKIWVEYCKTNNLNPVPTLENVLLRIATGKAILQEIRHIKANITLAES